MRRTLLILGVVVLSGFLDTGALGQSLNTNVQLALVGGTIFASPTEEPIRNGVILIDGDKIIAVGRRSSVRVPRGINVIDCTGLTITAGFWNSHVHFLERKWANAAKIPAPELSAQIQGMLTRYGVTTAFDTGSLW